MRTEIPVCNKCCMCLPLRYSLIVWGCVRLILTGVVLVSISFIIEGYIHILKSENAKRTVTLSEYVITCLAAIIGVADIVLGIIFIIGCYKKNIKFIRKYYHHNFFLLIILIPLYIYVFGFQLFHMIKYSKIPALNITLYVIADFIELFTYVVVQIYVLLLIRSEIVKLKNDCEYRFENRVAEAEIPLNVVISNGGTMTEIKKEIEDNNDI